MVGLGTSPDQVDMHARKVDVFARYSLKVAAACADARNGYDADLNIEPEFFGVDERSYMFARVQHKRFKWGTAVSFLSQATQDNPPHYYVPHNGHLQYEVWGVTLDKRFTVVASVSVSHPKFADWGDESARHAHDYGAEARQRLQARRERAIPISLNRV